MRLNLSFALVCMVRDSTYRYVNETAVATNASNAPLSFRQHEIIAPLVDAAGDPLAWLTKEQKDALDDVDDLQILYQQVRAPRKNTLRTIKMRRYICGFLFSFRWIWRIYPVRWRISFCVYFLCLIAQDGLDWNKEVQGSMLSAFYYGFCVTQVFGGWLSDRMAGSKAMYKVHNLVEI